MPDLDIRITDAPIETAPPAWDARFGAEASFVGVVRGMEGEKEIAGIDYTAYLPMAEKSLRELAREACRRFGEHRVRIAHRTGFVRVAEPSVEIQVGSAHSREAFEICRWYLERLKEDTPIWKQVVHQAQQR